MSGIFEICLKVTAIFARICLKVRAIFDNYTAEIKCRLTFIQ